MTSTLRISTEISPNDVSSEDVNPSASIYLNSLLDTTHYVDDLLYYSHVVAAIIGIPFNLFLIGIIVVLRRLRLSRNFTWIGIGLSNIYILIFELMVDVSVRWKSSPLTRSTLFWIAILCNATQSISLLLALLERHISITYPNWHKRYVTIGWIIAVQLVSSFFIFLLGNIHIQIFGEFRSEYFSSWNFKMIGTVTLSFFLIFLIGQLAAVRTTHQLKPEKENNSAENQQQHKSFFVLIGNNRVSLFELEAFQTIFLMGKIYFIFMVSVMISFGFVAFCLVRQSEPTVTQVLVISDEVQCSTSIQLFYYITGSICIHSALVNPAILLFFSSDLISVWKSFRDRRFLAKYQRPGASNVVYTVENGFYEDSVPPKNVEEIADSCV